MSTPSLRVSPNSFITSTTHRLTMRALAAQYRAGWQAWLAMANGIGCQHADNQGDLILLRKSLVETVRAIEDAHARAASQACYQYLALQDNSWARRMQELLMQGLQQLNEAREAFLECLDYWATRPERYPDNWFVLRAHDAYIAHAAQLFSYSQPIQSGLLPHETDRNPSPPFPFFTDFVHHPGGEVLSSIHVDDNLVLS